ncbi:MAG: Smr/MutS family protein [Gemmatimonadetes bacterium]|nr:Smr/MutS family protein [Gemmatimonadota bacterium]
MNAHALGILEYPRLLAHVAGRASSAPGAAAVRALAPRTDRGWIEAEHTRVGAVRALISSELGWPTEPIPDLGEPLRRLRIEGLTWTAVELLHGATLLRSSRRVRDALRDPRRPGITLAILADYAAALIDLRAQEEAIGRAIADDATVRDEASPTLRRVRRELRQAEGELVRLLEREMGKLEPHHQVSDLSVTMRNGRWVMPVRREARGYVGGIVHDSSGTGATIFVEPPAAVEFGNRVRELELEEQREVERVLRALTESLHPYHEAMQGAFAALVALDALYARARWMLEAQCAPVAFGAPADGLSIVDGRHPLLLAGGTTVVPFDLTLTADERTLLVSGPNTGGKTVLLKAVGLLAALAQSGVPVPVGPDSRLPVFDDMFADVGDEQSIEASLSTFSAHVKNLGEILRSATPDSLVLIDELGSGTDPAEGAALGGAILETLTARGTLTFATTHLGQLKLLATEVSGVVNASLQFDAVQLAPTYRLLKGVPGRSYGLSIARRLQLPEQVISRAEERLPTGERDLAVLLADVEAREALLTDRERLVERENDKARSRLATVADRELKVRERERELERTARQEARRYLLDARAQVEQAIAAVRAQGSASEAAFDEAARAARRSIEEAAVAQHEAADAVVARSARDQARAQQRATVRHAEAAPRGARAEAPLAAGDAVLVGTLGGKVGRITQVRGSEARVIVGSLTLTVPVTSLTRTAAAPTPTVRVALSGDVPDVEPVREVDVRGLRVDEVDDQVVQALDAAVRNDLRELRIIHGKGTGALRARVAEMLKRDTRVAGFRLGAWNEGGAGVTVAELA